MLMTLENSRFRVETDSLGAQLLSIWDKDAGREYLWQGPAPFSRASVLFPWCGPLAGGRFTEEGREYPADGLGFSAAMKHKLVCQDDSLVCYRMESGPETAKLSPYQFSVKTTYALKEERISSRFKVVNYGDGTMYFRCGFLTALNLPFVPGTTREDYDLLLEQPAALTLLERDGDGLLTGESRMWEPEDGRIPASGEALAGGLLLKEPPVQYLQLTCRTTGEFVRVQLRDSTHLSLRTGGSPEEGFLTVGVLYGTPDSRDSDPRPEKKEEITALGGMEEFYAHQAIEIGTV